MKHLKIMFPVLLCTLLLALSSCKETNADRLRAMRGNWESVKNRPAFTLFEENGHYRVTTYQKTYRGTTRTETYQVSEQDGFSGLVYCAVCMLPSALYATVFFACRIGLLTLAAS